MSNPSDKTLIETLVNDLIASNFLERSPALRNLLLHLKDRTVSGDDKPTTEYSIAYDLLGLDEKFDPQVNPIVRVSLRRLREALNDHYAQKPAPVRLHIPKRSYDLAVVREELPAPKPSWPKLGLGIAAAASVVAASLVWVFSADDMQQPYPLIRILPVTNLSGDRSADILEIGLQRQIATDLQRFNRVRVFVASPPEKDIKDADFTLRSSLLSITDDMDLTFRLDRERDAFPVYNKRVSGTLRGQDYFSAISEVSKVVSGQIAGQGGPTTADPDLLKTGKGRDLFAARGLDKGEFLCLVLTDRFFDDYDVLTFLRAYQCFEKERSSPSDDPFAEARFGTLAMHTVREFDLMPTRDLPDEIDWTASTILGFATDLVDRFPLSSDAFLLLGSVQNAMGDLNEAELSLRQAIVLNPGDPTARAVLAYALLEKDDFAGAIESAAEAIKLSAEPQGYIYLPIFLANLAKENKAAAIRAGETYVSKRTGTASDTIRLVVARLKEDQDAIANLSPIVASLDNPFEGFSKLIQSELVLLALQKYLPEVGAEAYR